MEAGIAARMRSSRPLLLAVVLGVLLFWAALPPTRAQGGSGAMVVNADYELYGTSPLTGGGHVTWTLTGDVARDLRARIVHLFKEYTVIPRGFRWGGDATSGTGSGQLTAGEGRAYTDHVELELEGYKNGTSGSRIGYFLLDRSDLFDTDPVGGFQRSTIGIVETDANSTADLQIKFLFNGYSSTSDTIMPLATAVFAESLFNVFTLDAVQSPTMSGSGVYPGSWPFLAEGGWHVVNYDVTHPALWAGNTSSCASGELPTCRYDGGTNASARIFMDPGLTPAVPWLDLRVATSARMTFNYTGRVNASADRLMVQAATAPTYADWTNVTNGTLSVGQNTGDGEWRTVTLDLSGYVGKQIRLRLWFVSPAGGSRGFFVRDVAIRAPSVYAGPIFQSDAHYLVGTLSFSNFQIPSGGVNLIRTPGGEIFYDSLGWSTAAPPPPDSVRFATFDVGENPQILFAVMVIAAYFISRLQEKAYDAFREAHPTVYRPAVHKTKWLHWVGRAAIGLLLLFYFLPTALFVIGVRVYFNGPAYWFLALTLALGLGLGTQAWYRQRLEEEPPPGEPTTVAPVPVAPSEEEPVRAPEVISRCTHCLRAILEGDKVYKCSCGAQYHVTCASGLMKCTTCRKPIALEVVRDKKSVSMRCESCGEVQTVPEGADPRALTCVSCGGRLRHLDAGKRYLLIASNPAIAFNWMRDLAKGGKPSLCLTSAAPERLRLEFGLKGVQLLQVSTQGAPGALDPKKLDPQGLKSILPIAREGKGGVILYDGLDQMISQSSVGDVTRFLRKANDMAFVHGVTVIARVGPGVLADSEVQRIASEFDEVLDLSAQL